MAGYTYWEQSIREWLDNEKENKGKPRKVMKMKKLLTIDDILPPKKSKSRKKKSS